SILCALAPGERFLIGSRGFQALGAAMLFANAPAILTGSSDPRQRGQALGSLATMTYLGLTIGPSLGGWLAQHLGWRSVFAINVPVGVLALVMSLRFLPDDQPASRRERFDLLGAALFLGGLVLLLLALNQGHAWGWASAVSLAALAGSAGLLAAFFRHETRTSEPMLDLSLFRVPVFTLSTVSALLNYVCLFTVTFLLPFYLVEGRGMQPARAGLILTAQPLVMAIAAPLSGTLSDRIGTRGPATFGMAVLATGLYLLSRLGPDAGVSSIVGSLAVVGLGTGLFISPNNSALMGSAPRHRQGIASAILATARNVGMVLGIGVGGAIFTTVLGPHETTEGSALYRTTAIAFRVSMAIAILGMLTSWRRNEREERVSARSARHE
ncbi:MAG: MFS transporter, partial [Candidatus Eisenbacteria bacterium]|nr:MFS transporter [Candidatus Eisenbacteria bacterium]